MLFSVPAEICICICGLLYVMDKWFDSYINLMELMQNNDTDDEDKRPMSETVKRMYS